MSNPTANIGEPKGYRPRKAALKVLKLLEEELPNFSIKYSSIYQLTEQSFVTLKKQNMPDEIISKLNFLIDQEFRGEEHFLETIEKTIGYDEAIKYKELILKYAEMEEDDLNQELVILLNRSKENSAFLFKAEYKKRGNKRKVDIGVLDEEKDEQPIKVTPFQATKAFFVIECKRLYNNSKKQYVKGNTGGIERFKRKLHGGELPDSAIVGYVQKYDFSHWHSKVNFWIDELIKIDASWQAADKLKLEPNYPKELITKYKSISSREKSSPITLFHLWVKMN